MVLVETGICSGKLSAGLEGYRFWHRVLRGADRRPYAHHVKHKIHSQQIACRGIMYGAVIVISTGYGFWLETKGLLV